MTGVQTCALPIYPLLSEREFALAPLCEIMRQRRHPVTGQTMEEMYEALRPNEN